MLELVLEPGILGLQLKLVLELKLGLAHELQLGLALELQLRLELEMAWRQEDHRAAVVPAGGILPGTAWVCVCVHV